MMPDGRMFYFTSAATVRQLSEILLKETKIQKDKRKEGRG
jgi:hypothetical protein